MRDFIKNDLSSIAAPKAMCSCKKRIKISDDQRVLLPVTPDNNENNRHCTPGKKEDKIRT
jgi:hypothetical protein